MEKFVTDFIDKVFNDNSNPWMWGLAPGNEQRGYEIERSEDSVDLIIEVPGYAKEDLKLSLEKDCMTIEGELENREFSKSFRLPKDVDTENIKASVDKGILTISLPKKEDPEPTIIEIN